MPKAPSGPRRIDSSGTWYAVISRAGKKHYRSLGTKVKSEALRLWPSVYAELEASLAPPKYKRGTEVTITEYDPATGAASQRSEWVENLVPESHLVDPEDDTQITWKQAEEIAAKRYERRKGKPVSRSWRYQILNALRHLDVKHPLSVRPSDVRRMVDDMEGKGYAPTTIAQRASSLSGVIEALIKGGYTDDEYNNPFERVDTAAVSTKSHYKAEPSDYLWAGQVRDTYKENHLLTLHILITTGVRISEWFNGHLEQRDGQWWLSIRKTVDYTPKNRASIRDVPIPNGLVRDVYRGTTGTEDSYRRWFNPKRPHAELVSHSWRHGWRTAARMAGADEYVAERLLGHSAGSRMSQLYGSYPDELLITEASKVWAQLEQWMSISGF